MPKQIVKKKVQPVQKLPVKVLPVVKRDDGARAIAAAEVVTRAKRVAAGVVVHLIEQAQSLSDELRNAVQSGDMNAVAAVADIIDAHARSLQAAALAAK